MKFVDSNTFYAFRQVFQLKVSGVAFRLIPESSQVENALRVSNIVV